MSLSKAIPRVLLLAAILMPAGHGALGQVMPGSQAQFPEMAMRVQTNRRAYWAGEPVIAQVRVVNWLSPYLRLLGSFGLRGRETEVRILGPSGTSDAYWGPYSAAPTDRRRVALRYAKAHEFHVSVLYDEGHPQGTVFWPTGKYRLDLSQRMAYVDLHEGGILPIPFQARAVSPPFEVAQPPEEYREALETVLARPGMMRDMQMRQATAANVEALMALAERYPQSRYAPFCLDACAGYAAILAPGRPKEMRNAIALYERLTQNYPDYVWHDEARMTLADFYYRDGHADRAIAIARGLVAQSERNLYRFYLNPVMRPLAGEKTNSNRHLNDNYWFLFGTTDLPEAWFQVHTQELPGRD